MQTTPKHLFIRTLADFKRLPIGQSLTLLENTYAPQSKALIGTPRRIVKVQTNGFYLETPGNQSGRSYLPFPSAKQFDMVGDTVTITDSRDPSLFLKYRIN